MMLDDIPLISQRHFRVGWGNHVNEDVYAVPVEPPWWERMPNKNIVYIYIKEDIRSYKKYQ